MLSKELAPPWVCRPLLPSGLCSHLEPLNRPQYGPRVRSGPNCPHPAGPHFRPPAAGVQGYLELPRGLVPRGERAGLLSESLPLSGRPAIPSPGPVLLLSQELLS